MATPFFRPTKSLMLSMVGEFDVHVEGDSMLGEKLDDALAVGRLDDVSDEGFFAEGFDVDIATLREFMAGPDDEHEGIAVELDGGEFALFGEIGDDADVELVIEKLAGHVAREDAVNADVDAGIEGAEAIESREQGVDGAFVDADGDLAALKALEFVEAFANFFAEVEHPVCVFEEQHAGVGEGFGACTGDEQGLADPFFELAHGDANGGLGAEELLGGARVAALVGYHLEHLQRC